MATAATNLAAFIPAVASNLVLKTRGFPSPGPGEILIRNHAIAINAADMKVQAWGFAIPFYPWILGSDTFGVVVEVGPSVTAFKLGDRVLGLGHWFVSGNADHAAFQTYTVLRTDLTALLPSTMSFQQGATFPSAISTAAITLFAVLGLPLPKRETTLQTSSSSSSILVWSGASSSGSMTIQLARIAGLTVFTTASKKHHDYLRSFGATVIVVYHSPTAIDDLVAAAARAGKEIEYAVDAISLAHTLSPVLQVLSSSAGTVVKKLAHLLPLPEDLPIPDGIEARHVSADKIFDPTLGLSAWLHNENLPNWMERGIIKPTPYKVIEGGLSGLESALYELKKGVSGEKLIVEL